MATEVRFPRLSKESADSVGVLSTWFVREGEAVREDQVLAEVMVDKVAAEVVAPASGTAHLLVEEEAEVHQDDVIATIR